MTGRSLGFPAQGEGDLVILKTVPARYANRAGRKKRGGGFVIERVPFPPPKKKDRFSEPTLSVIDSAYPIDEFHSSIK